MLFSPSSNSLQFLLGYLGFGLLGPQAGKFLRNLLYSFSKQLTATLFVLFN